MRVAMVRRGGTAPSRGACRSVDDQPVVAGGELGIDAAQVGRRRGRALAKAGVAGLGRAAMSVAVAGLVDLRDQPGERADTGEVGEAVEVTEAGEDAGAEDTVEAGHRSDDAAVVTVTVVVVRLLVGALNRVSMRLSRVGDLGVEAGERQRTSTAMSTASSAKSSPAARPQLERFVGGGDQIGRLVVAPRVLC